MKHLPRKLARIAAVATAETDSFVALARLAGLDPARAFRGANLSNVDFGTDDITGFDFTGANLEGADLSRVTGQAASILEGVSFSSRTRWPRVVHHFTAIGVTVGPPVVGTPTLHQGLPPDFSEAEVRRRILANEPVPPSWHPNVRELDFSIDWRSSRRDRESVYDTLARIWANPSSLILRDVSPLSRFQNLERLNISGCEIISFGISRFLTKLKSIDISYTKITSLDDFSSARNLVHINMCSTKIYDVTPISQLPNLEIIDAGSTKIKDISPLSNLPKLHTLNVMATPLTDISSASRFPKLQVIYVINTHVPNNHGIDPSKNIRIFWNDGMRWPWEPLRGPIPPGRTPPRR